MTVVPIVARLADSTRPASIPDQFRLRPNGVAPYIDGALYRWPQAEIATFPRVWRVCVTGDLRMAPHARALDVERFDATPEHVRPYAEARAELGERTIVYANRDSLPAIAEAVGASSPLWPELEWWIATLDNLSWDPQSLASQIEALHRVKIEPGQIRAIQIYPMGAYDVSNVYWKAAFSLTAPR